MAERATPITGNMAVHFQAERIAALEASLRWAMDRIPEPINRYPQDGLRYCALCGGEGGTSPGEEVDHSPTCPYAAARQLVEE